VYTLACVEHTGWWVDEYKQSVTGVITPGTVEELQNEVQVLHNRIDEETKKTIELCQEKDELEKVSKHNEELLSLFTIE